MSPKLTPSNPDEVMAIRDLTPRMVTLSVPFERAGVFKVGGRATIGLFTHPSSSNPPCLFRLFFRSHLSHNTATTVKLSTGSLAVFSPVALTNTVRERIAALGGPVSYIIAPDTEHHIFISAWKEAYPAARLVGPEGLPEKRSKSGAAAPGEHWDHVFERATKATMRITDEFDVDFDYEYVDGHANRELVFLFKPERVLIQADLMFNLPATEQYSRVPGGVDAGGGFADKIALATNTTQGNLKWVRRFLWHVASSGNRASFNESVKKIDTWDFGTVIPCHGDVLEGEEGKAAFRRVMEWHLKA